MNRLLVFAFACACTAGISSPTTAQTIGIGPRISFVRGDVASPDTASARYVGGIFRARTSPHTGVELALDYRTATDQVLKQKTRDMPFQGSVLLYPVRTSIGLYVLGGVGWYNQKIEPLVAAETATSVTKMGYHAGVGGELAVGRRAAIHLDYRYTFLHIGDQATGTSQAGAVPIPGLTGVQEKLKLSHEGSMWTTGLTVYF